MLPDDFSESIYGFKQTVFELGRLLEVYIQVEMMKATNTEREMRGESLAYPEKAFSVAQDTAHEIVISIDKIM